MGGLNMSVSILDLDIAKEIIQIVKNVTEDERIDKKIREEYKNKMKEIVKEEPLKYIGKDFYGNEVGKF